MGYRLKLPLTMCCILKGMEAVLPIEMGVHSLRTTLESEIPKADWLQGRYDQLCMLDEKRLKALYHIQGYQRRLRKTFDKKVRSRDLKLGDLVLKEIWAPVQDANGKCKQNWAGPYIIKQIYSREAVRLIDLNANPFTEPTNMDLCMSMWLQVRTNKQLNMWNIDFESIKTWKKKLNNTNMWKQKQNK